MYTARNSQVFSIAIILAGGSGRRAAQSSRAAQSQPNGTKHGQPKPKQLWQLGAMPVWQHSWQRFALHPQIDHVCCVWPKEYVDAMRSKIARLETRLETTHLEQNNPQWPKPSPSSVIAGGPTRNDSTAAALEFCREQICPQVGQRRLQVLIHDAARPLVSQRMIDQTFIALKHYKAVVCALPSQDSIFEQKQGQVSKIIERDSVMCAQTPQSFDFLLLLEAFAKHRAKHKTKHKAAPEITASDDISIVKHYLPQTDIAVIPGEASNLKLTEACDLLSLESHLKNLA